MGPGIFGIGVATIPAAGNKKDGQSPPTFHEYSLNHYAHEEPPVMRIASCSCGSLRADTTGEPIVVAACHCRECQRRTGAPFGVTVLFPKGQVRIHGLSKEHVRDGQEGRKVRFYFCPDCGTTVFWHPEVGPDAIGVALGAFADPSFPEPTVSIWEEAKHPWVTFQHELRHSQSSRSV
jgi:hypothetical protein